NEPKNPFLPHNYVHNTVAYTGTHDNDTTVGWFHTIPDHEKYFLSRYRPGANQDIAWSLLRMAWESVADYAIAPLQDLLRLPTTARMNFPGRPNDNWQWRFTNGQVTPALGGELAELTEIYRRA